MNYVGVDIYKRYSVLVAVDERGRELRRGGINGNETAGFAQFFSSLGAGASWVRMEDRGSNFTMCVGAHKRTRDAKRRPITILIPFQESRSEPI